MSALKTQIAGRHYKDLKIQPVEYIHANKLTFLEGCVVKRITRWRDKDGFQDLLKIKHEIDLIIELETRDAAVVAEPESKHCGNCAFENVEQHMNPCVFCQCSSKWTPA
jgi:hypothetical protein